VDFGPSLVDRVELILGPHAGYQVSESALIELTRQVDRTVRDTLVDLHYEGEEITVLVKNDEVLGPVCLIRNAWGKQLPLAEFERGLRPGADREKLMPYRGPLGRSRWRT
jgi:hypothetical protein